MSQYVSEPRLVECAASKTIPLRITNLKGPTFLRHFIYYAINATYRQTIVNSLAVS